MKNESGLPMFTKKINTICSNDNLRPSMSHIMFKDGFIVATNANILIRQNLKLYGFSEEQIKLMQEKFLHKNTFKLLLGLEIKEVDADGIVALKDGSEIKFLFAKADWKYPNYEAVLPFNSPVQMIDEIGFNDKNIQKILSVMFNSTGGFKMCFYGKSKAIKITSTSENESEQMAILMPILIN